MRSDHSLGFMFLMYTFWEVIPHNRGTYRKPLGCWPSPKKICTVWWYYISCGDINSPMFICGPPPTFLGNDPKRSLEQSLLRFFPSTICCLSPPSSTSGQPWKVSGWQRLGFVWFFGPLSMGPGAEVWVFLFFSGPKTEQAFREFSSPPLGWMSIHVFWIWMIKSWINDDLLTDLMLDKAIFSIILFVGLLVKIQPRKSHHFPLGMFMDSIQIDSGILRGGMHHLWNSGAIVFTTDHKFPWETRLCLRKKLERSSNTSEIK